MGSAERRIAQYWMLTITVGVLFLFSCVLGRLVYLHIFWKGSTPPKYIASEKVLALRGKILDRNGQILAESVPGREIAIDPQDPKLDLPSVNRATLPLDLANILDVREELVIAAFHETKNRNVKLCTTANETVIQELQQRRSAPTNRIAGVAMTEKEIRSWPNGARLCHILGYINAEGEGVYGIEQRYQKQLQGEDGTIVMALDGRRREIRDRRQEEIPEVPGNNIYLTIDNNIQYIIENALSTGISHFGASSGTIIVQRVKTGEILGMATLPSFNPQHYRDVDKNRWKNNAISRSFEPGSVMKVLTLASALQHGVITPASTFDVGKTGVWYYAGRPLRDHAYGIVHPAEIIAKSSNIGTAMIGLRMAEPAPSKGFTKEYERLWYAFSAVGFGRPTGIELPGEEGGILPHFSHWSKLSPTRMTIGQGIAVTPIQLCNAYSTVANGGKLMRPYLVKEIRTHDNKLIETTQPEVRGTPFSTKTSKQMLLMMQGTVEPGGTARRARLENYTVAGKTGTAQIPVRGGYSNSDYNATFVGIFPASAPELCILVTLERPHLVAHTGGGVAAPIFKEVAEEIAKYLAIPADRHAE